MSDGTSLTPNSDDDLRYFDAGDISNGQAGPSRPGETAMKKRKFSRSRTACIPCRMRKAKCASQPPGPCQHCTDAGLTCQWPLADGRSSKFRLQKSKVPDLAAMANSGSGGQQTPVTELPDLTVTKSENDANDWYWNNPEAGASQILESFSQRPVGVDNGNSLNFGSGSSFFNTPSSSSMGQIMNQPYSDYNLDLAQIIMTVSSQLPTVEETTPIDEALSTTSSSKRHEEKLPEQGKVVKITWWRPHGQTAIAPGLKRITLKVRMDHRSENAMVTAPATGQLFLPNNMPDPTIMRHLLDVFMTHFGCQFPFLDRQRLDYELDSGTGSVFLFNCIAAAAARFSTHPLIALPGLEPSAYGNPFCERAKRMLGNMLAVPSRDTVIAFLLSAHLGFAYDSESEVWIMTGLAVRMSIDLGLHLATTDSQAEDDPKLNRLVFWSVLLMDYALSFGTGRQTSFRVEEITQALPTPADFSLPPDATVPFIFAAKQMLSYGPIINILNGGRTDHFERELQIARSRVIEAYNDLPQDMRWNVANLQHHCRNKQGPIYLHLHLWMHTVIASEYLIGTSVLRRPNKGLAVGGRSGAVTPNTLAASNLWRNSVRTIGDILVLSDIIDPLAYCALPFVNQAFYVAGCCYIKEIEQHANDYSRRPLHSSGLNMTSIHPPDQNQESNGSKAELSRALLTSVATTNISTLQSGLAKQTTYWSGVAWVAGALNQRVSGMTEIDLVEISERLTSSVTLPDSGLVQRSAKQNDSTGDMVDWGAELDMDLFSLPFDTLSAPPMTVTEQDMPIPHFLQSSWFLHNDGSGHVAMGSNQS